MEDKQARKPSDGSRRKNYRWDADSATKDGLTSLDVLLTWMATPGNLARWRSNYHKADLCGEMVTALRDEGIAHREIKDVRFKVWTMEKNFASAEKYLEKEGQREAFLAGTASKEVQEHMRLLCPQFRELEPAMNAVADMTDVGKKSKSKSSNEGSAAGSSTSEVDVKSDQMKPKPASSLTKRKTEPSAVPRTMEPKRRAVENADGFAAKLQAMRLREVPSADLAVAESEVLSQLTDEERVQRQELFDLKRTLLQNEITAKKAQQDVQLKCEKMLARKKLLDADVAPADVDSAFPL